MVFKAASTNRAWELWKSDGTPEGTAMIKSGIGAVDPSAPRYLGKFADLTVAGDMLYFAADNGEHGKQLWKSDGSVAGTSIVPLSDPPALSRPQMLTAVGERLFFTTDDGLGGHALWVAGGTAGGPTLLKTISTDAPVGWNYDLLTASADKLYFKIHLNNGNDELWTSDGTPQGTVRVLRPGSAAPQQVYAIASTSGGILAAVQRDGFELVRVIDGSTVPLSQRPVPVQFIPGPMPFMGIEGRVFFAGSDPEHGFEPWLYDPAAGAAQHHAAHPLDVDANGEITPLDVLIVINALNADGSHAIGGGASEGTAVFTDVDGDGFLTPRDALVLINHLNSMSFARSTPSELMAASTVASAEAITQEPDFAMPAAVRSSAFPDGAIEIALRFAEEDAPNGGLSAARAVVFGNDVLVTPPTNRTMFTAVADEFADKFVANGLTFTRPAQPLAAGNATLDPPLAALEDALLDELLLAELSL